MTVSRHQPMNEELLSAYLDNEVTDEERALVEAAIAADPAIAWQVDSLRQTIHLLQELPALTLPRAFTIEAIVTEAKRQEAIRTPAPNMGAPNMGAPNMGAPNIGKKPAFAQQASNEDQTGDWWQWLQQIWQGGNLPLRNAAALAFTLMLVLLVSNRFVAPYQPPGSQENTPIIIQTATNGTGSGNRTANSASTKVTAQLETTPLLESSGTASTTQPPVASVIQEQAIETTSEKLPVQTETTTAESTAMTLRGSVRGPGADEDDLTGGSPNAAMQSAQSEGAASPMQDSARTAMTASFAQSANASTSLTTALSTTVITNHNAQNQTTTVLTLTPTVTVTLTDSVMVEAMTPSVSLSTDITESLEQPTPTEAIRDEVTNRAGSTNRWLEWAQLITALCAVVLGGLWWRSRE